jgi:hypothetical protein
LWDARLDRFGDALQDQQRSRESPHKEHQK